ncbi:MFS family permease [Paenibacillus phyllosphaerae]|uniref:MFS family permease n=1 Tax=Paenibacillus phyllosphaerae TaxID=274593 RepID=A0A7W5B3W0_9BACL|nr:MFS transporter [Paenibacillus phyllosphaerae]MBB3113476.1 MFS family permease [Paenibacillus phyllosphaerae]
MFLETAADEQTTGQSASRPLWRNRPFLFLFSGMTLSVFGNCFHSIALNLWVLQATGSAKLMSAVTLTHMLSSLLFGTFAGTIADRFDRRKLILMADTLRCLFVLGIAGAMAFLPSPMFVILILTALSAVVGLVHGPSFQASLTDLVGRDRIQQAAGVMNIADNAARISGLALGGIIVAAFGGITAIVTDAIMFACSVLCVVAAGKFPKRKQAATTPKSSFKDDYTEGFMLLWRNPFAKAVLFLTTITLMFFTSTLMLIQVMAVRIWEASPVHFGLIEAAIPLGYAIGASIILTISRKQRHRGKLILGSLILMGPFYSLIAVMSGAQLAIPFIFLVGILFSFCTLLVSVIMRIEVPSELQGRMFGMLGSLSSAAPPVGLAISAALADHFSPDLVLFSCGLLVFIAGIAAAIMFKPIRRYH